MNMAAFRWNRACLFWLLAAIIIFSGMGLRDPWPADEPRFALIARDMVDTGNWLIPMRGGELYPDKPPVFMWAIALFYLLTGNLNIAFLLPSALSALLALGSVRWFLRQSHGDVLAGSLALITTVQFSLQAKTAQIDATLVGFTTLSLCLLLYHLTVKSRWYYAYLAGFFAGIGVITKGVGFLPLLTLIPYFFLKNHHSGFIQHRLFDPRWLGIVAAFLVAILLWLLPMLWVVANGDSPEMNQYRDNILFRQTVGRYVDSWHHIEPWHYYLSEVILWAWFPLVFILPGMLLLLKRYWSEMHSGVLLVLSWAILVFIFFSLSPGKRGVYMLPIVPALALGFGLVYPFFSKENLNTWAWRVVLLLSCAMGGFSFLVLSGVVNPPKVDGETPNLFGLLLPLFLFCMLMACLYCFARKKLVGTLALVLWMAGFWPLLSFFGFPLLNPLRTSAQMMTTVESALPSGDAYAMLDWKEQYSLFSSEPITHFGYAKPMSMQLQAARQWESQLPQRRWLLLSQRYLDQCHNEKEIYIGPRHRTEWYLVDRC